MMRPVRTVPPAEGTITLAEASVAARTVSEDDDYVSALILAADAHLDGRQGLLGRCMVTQTWRYDMEMLCEVTRLDMPDAQSVVVTYFDGDGVEQTVAAGDLSLSEGHAGAVVHYTGGSVSLDPDRLAPVSMTVVFGMGAAADVPPPLKQAAKMLVTHWYEHREAVSESAMMPVPMGVDRLIAPYRWSRI